MKNILLLLLTLCTIQIARAQNYQCVQYGPVHYFTNSDGYLRAIRIDSVKAVGADSVFYPFKSMRSYPYSYCGPQQFHAGGCWLGEKIIKKPAGIYIVPNLYDREILIKTLANVGESWRFYTDTGAIYYVATVQSTDTMTVLGEPDSIKTIKITAYRDTLINFDDRIHGFTMSLSKNHGFVRTFDLHTFPYRRLSEYIVEPLQYDYYLDAATEALWNMACDITMSSSSIRAANSVFNLVPFKKVREIDLYDFDVNDTFQFEESSSAFGSSSGNKTSHYITSKTINPTSYTYTYNWEKNHYSMYYGTVTSSTYTTGYGEMTYDTTWYFTDSLLPEEWGNYYLIYYFPNYSISGCRTIAYDFVISNLSFSSRTTIMSPSGVGTRIMGRNSTKYAIGYGEIGNSDYISDFHPSNRMRLTFASKSGVRCGVYGPVAVQDLLPVEPLKLEIFPNPAGSTLSISAGIELTDITISNMLGSTVFQQSIAGTQATLPIAHLTPGLYLLRINNHFVRKFVKE